MINIEDYNPIRNTMTYRFLRTLGLSRVASIQIIRLWSLYIVLTVLSFSGWIFIEKPDYLTELLESNTTIQNKVERSTRKTQNMNWDYQYQNTNPYSIDYARQSNRNLYTYPYSNLLYQERTLRWQHPQRNKSLFLRKKTKSIIK